MLNSVKDHDERSWWKHQPWVNVEFKDKLLTWEVGHSSWWHQMSSKKNHWKKFALNINDNINIYDYNSKLSIYFQNKMTSYLDNLFSTIELLEQKIERS